MAFPARKRRTVAIGVLGQSNEHGAVSLTELTTKPQAFKSLRRLTVRAPLGPAISRSGGYWLKVHDDLYDAGWEPRIINGAVGSMSFVKDGAGLMGSWAAGTSYFRQRPPVGPADRGYAGDLIQVRGGIWRCVIGQDKYALNAGPNLTGEPGRGDGLLDTVVTQPGGRPTGSVETVTITGTPTGGTFTLKGNGNETATIAYNASAATVQAAVRTLGGVHAMAAVSNTSAVYTVTSAPSAFEYTALTLGTNSLTGGTTPSVTITPNTFINYVTGASDPFPSDVTLATLQRGYTVTETPAGSANAGITWRYEGLATSSLGGTTLVTTTWPLAGTVLTDAYAGMGFDPLGLVHRLHEKMQDAQADRKIIYLANGQADLGQTQAAYQAALTSLANFYLGRGYEVMIGMTNYSPGSGGSYTNVLAARTAALAALEAGTDADRVHAGPDLYTLMGTTGPMAASGAFLASDNVHLNGAGCVGPASSGVQPAGKHVADAIKVALANPPSL